jgi:hypothetical protein
MRAMIVLVIVGLTSIVARQTSQRVAFANVPLYEAVLDDIFKYTAPTDVPSISLRFDNEYAGEFQLLIASASVTEYRVQRWKLPQGAPSVWRQLESLFNATGRMPTITEALKAIPIEKSVAYVRRDSATGQLLDRWASFKLELLGSELYTLDGAHYTVRSHSAGSEIRFATSGPADGKLSRDPIVKWMAEVRSALDGEKPEFKSR